MTDRIDALIEEILADAYGDDEQLGSFALAFETSARFPFSGRVVGVPVEVTSVSYDGDERRGLVAVCRRQSQQYRVTLVDLSPGPVAVETSMLVEAYRRWCGLPPSAVEPSVPAPSAMWSYRPLAHASVTVDSPLGLHPQGTWDPAEEYWGEPDDEPHPVVTAIIAAGPRPEFEMEQVIPGVEADDWESDPVADAAELHRAGADRQASRLLEDLIAADERCIDAWVHLGNIAFDAKSPKAALPLYDRSVAIGEASLPAGFTGVLPWGLIDNRPFLRGLYGLGLCAWRQRRWEDAAQIFLSRTWLEGAGTWDSLSCLDAVTARLRWTRR
ncbi:MAG: tetratricopeptide repeat protein [Acidimicrobiales bacterium]